MNNLFLFILNLLLVAGSARATRIYISNSGSNSAPYTSAATATSSPVDAFNQLTAGTRDTVVFYETGAYSIAVPCTIGIDSAVIMAQSPAVQGTIITADAATDTQHMIWVTDNDDIIIKDIYLDGNDKAISGVGHGGLDRYRWEINGVEFFNIRPDEDAEAWTAGVIIFAQNRHNGNLITGCTFHDIEGRVIHFKSLDNSSDRNEISYCTFYDIDGMCIDIWDQDPSRLIVHHNLCYNSVDFFNTYEGVCDTVTYNTVYGNSGIGFNMTGRVTSDSFNVYRYNIAWDNAGGDFIHGDGTNNNFTFDYNCYDSLENGIAAGVNDIRHYPEFTDSAGKDFTLLNNSACVNASFSVVAGYDMDSTETPVGAYNDLGCYETGKFDLDAWAFKTCLPFINGFIGTAQRHVPLLVHLDNTKIDYARINPDGSDLRFTDADSVAVLDYEIEVWDYGNDSYIWVRVPEISATGTADSIFMYYGNSGASALEDTAGVWINNYAGVWHLNEDMTDEATTGILTDATGFSHDGFQKGVKDTSGWVGNGMRFDGTDDYVAVSSVIDEVAGGDMTVGFWVWSSVSAGQQFFTGINDATGNTNRILVGHSAGVTYTQVYEGAGFNDGSATVVNSAWHHVFWRLDDATNDSIDLFVDGQIDIGFTTAPTSVAATDSFVLGMEYDNGPNPGDYLNGIMDEVRVSSVVRTDTWLEVQDSSMRDNLIDWDATVTEGAGPSLVSANYYSDGLPGPSGDSLVVVFTESVDDVTVSMGAGNADVEFEAVGYGNLDNATITTGATADDETLVVYFTATDSTMSRMRSYLAVGSGIDKAGGGTFVTDTIPVETWNVINTVDDEAFKTIYDAKESGNLSNGDTVLVLDEGYYTEPLNGGGAAYYLRSADGYRPQIRYNGTTMNGSWRGSDLMIWTDDTDIYGFVINGVNIAEDDTAGRIYMGNGSIEACSLRYISTYFGGGMDTIRDCYFTGSNGIYYRSSTGYIEGNVVENGAPGNGALYLYNCANATFKNNILRNNTGNAVYMRNGVNNRFINNLAYGNTGLCVTLYGGDERPYDNKWYNNTFYGNGGQVTLDSNCVFKNNIVLNNGGSCDIAAGDGIVYAESLMYNWVDTTGSGLGALFGSATNVVDGSDPMFTDTTGRDFHLNPSSPAKNYTVWNADSATFYDITPDLGGNQRPLGGYVDLGCYEDTTVSFSGVHYHTDGIDGPTGDSIVVILNVDVSDASVDMGGGNASNVFADTGCGYLANATIVTGSQADDDTLVVRMAAGDSVFSHLRSGLRLIAGTIDSAGGGALPADTMYVTTWNAVNLRTDSAYQAMSAACALASDGDTVAVFDNGFYTDTLALDVWDLDNFTLMAGGSSVRPVIRPDGVTMNRGWQGTKLVFFDGTASDGNTYQGLEFDSRQLDGSDSLNQMAFFGSSNRLITIRNCVFRSSNGVGAYMYVWGDSVIVDSCEAYNCATAGLLISGSSETPATYNRVTNSRFHDCAGYGISTTAQYATFDRNVFYNVEIGIRGGYGGIYDSKIVNNLFYACRDDGIANAGSGYEYTFGRNLIAWNTVYGCGGDGIAIYDTVGAVDTVKYNICWDNTGNDLDTVAGGALSTRPVSDYNVYETAAEWVAGAHSATTNPQFVNTGDIDGTDNVLGTADDGLALGTDSPYLGYSDRTDAGTDVAGQTRPMPAGTPLDLGAYEEQTVKGAIMAATYYSDGNPGAAGDSMVVVFGTDVDDATVDMGAGNADAEFGILGWGSLLNATISTGSQANDDTLLIRFTSSDTILSRLRDTLILSAASIDTNPGGAFPADTIAVTTYNVSVEGGAAYATIAEAYAAAGAGDSISLLDAGIYAETLVVAKAVNFFGYGIDYGSTDSLPVWTCGSSAPGSNNLLSVQAACSLKSIKFVGTADFNTVLYVAETADPDVMVLSCRFDGRNLTGTGLAAPNTIDSQDADLVVDSCTFANFTDRCIYNVVDGGSSDIRNSTFHHSAYGVYLYNAVGYVVRNNVIYGCTGSGIYMRGGTADELEGRITGNLIYECDNGILPYTALDEQCRGNLIAFNTVAQCTTYGIRTRSLAGTPDTVMYNILWSNGTDIDTFIDANSQRPVADYNWFTGGNSGSWVLGAGSDSGYPQFADTLAAGGTDWSLLPSSPCIGFTDADAAQAAAYGAGTDIAGNTRPSPAGSYADAGAYEEQGTYGTLLSASYFNDNAAGTAGDSIMVVFRVDVDDATVDMGAGNADNVFADTGLGYLGNATIHSGSQADDDTLVIVLAANDTIFSQLRSGIRLLAGAVDSAGGGGIPADTVAVTTWNVYNKSLDTPYRTIHNALASATDNDTIYAFDNGYYTDTLGIGLDDLYFSNAGSNTPVIKADEHFMDRGWQGTDLLLISSRAMTWYGFEFDGRYLDGTDSISRNIAYINPGSNLVTLRKCTFHGSNDNGIYSHSTDDDLWIIDSCLFYNIVDEAVDWTGDTWASRVTHSTFRNCGNGLRVHGDSSLVAGNVFQNCTNGITQTYGGNNRMHYYGNLFVDNDRGIDSRDGRYKSHYARIMFNTFFSNNVGLELCTAVDSVDTAMYNVFWANNIDMDTLPDAGAATARPVADYNHYRPGCVDDWVVGANSDSGYPVFADTTDPDGPDDVWGTADDGLRLRISSPCISFSDLDAAAAAAIGITTDITGAVRPAPAGMTLDAGAYEEQTADGPQPSVDSVHYFSCGTRDASDDTMIAWFSLNLEYDSLPGGGTGAAANLFGLLGLGSIASAVLDTPDGLPDTNFIFIRMTADDTILCRNRSRLALRADSAYGTAGFGCPADTDTVVTYNVHHTGGASYRTLGGAYAAAGAGDSIQVWDAGVYPESLNIKQVTSIIGYGIDFGSYDSLPVLLDPPGMTAGVICSLSAPCTLVALKFVSNTADVQCIEIENDSTVTGYLIKRCVLEGNGVSQRGIMRNGSNCRSEDMLIDSCTVRGFTSNGIYLRGDWWASPVTVISNCLFENGSGVALYKRDGIAPDTVRNCVFRNWHNNYGMVRFTGRDNCVFTGNTLYGSRALRGAFFADWETDNLEFTGNVIYNVASDNGAVQVDDGANYWRFTNNLIYDCDVGVGPYGTADTSEGSMWAFNTVVMCTTAGFRIRTHGTNPDTVRYNIFWSNNGADLTNQGAPDPVTGYNFHTVGGIVDWPAMPGADSGNADFVDTVAAGGYDWHLNPTSPAADLTHLGASALAVLGMTDDIEGTVRPLPVKTFADAGCYEEQTGYTFPRIDSAKYWSAGTETVDDDTMIVWFTDNLEFDSLPGEGHGTGLADNMFDLIGLGSIVAATVDTPVGCPDTNFIIVRMNAGDTILCHNRSILALTPDSAYTTLGKAAVADTDSVVTYNVYLDGTTTSYLTLVDAEAVAVDGNEIHIWDAGLYDGNYEITEAIDIIGYGIDYGADWITGDSLPVLTNTAASAGTLMFFNAFVACTLQGLKFSDVDDSKGIEMNGNNSTLTLKKCVFDGHDGMYSGFNNYRNDGNHVVDSCDFSRFAGYGIDNWNDSYLHVTNCRFHDGIEGLRAYADGQVKGGMVFTGNLFWNLSGAAIYCRSTDYLTCTNNLFVNCNFGYFEWTLGENDGTYCAFNTAVNCTSAGFTMHSTGVVDTVLYNVAWHCGTAFTGGDPVNDYNWWETGTSDGWTPGAHCDSGAHPVFADTANMPWGADGIWLTADDAFIPSTGSPLIDVSGYSAAGTDIRGVTRPLPAGSNWDLGCYEEQTAVQLRIDSVKYWAAGTESWADDSLIVWFSDNLEFDSLPTGAGDAEKAFNLQGLGYMANASLDTPNGMPDTNFVIIRMNAGDTIMSHLRSILSVNACSLYSTVGAPCLADTDSVDTWNVYNLTTDAAYRSIFDAGDVTAGASDGDTILVCDAGYYTDTLALADDLVFMSTVGLTPVIRYDGDSTTRDHGAGGVNGYLVVRYADCAPEFHGFEFDGRGLTVNDTVRRLVGVCSGKFVECVFHHADYGLFWTVDDGQTDSLVVDSCEFYAGGNQGFLSRRDNTSKNRISRSSFHDNAGGGLTFYVADSTMIDRCRIYDNTGSGIYLRHARHNLIAGNLVYGNSGTGIDMHTGNVGDLPMYNSFINNTIYGNAGGGLVLDSMGLVANNVLYGNTGWQLRIATGVVTAEVRKDSIRYNLADTTGSGIPDSVTEANGNIVDGSDPLFTNPGADSFSLQTSSPCIGATDWSTAEAAAYGIGTDLYGNPRPAPPGSYVDMGALEEQNTIDAWWDSSWTARKVFIIDNGFVTSQLDSFTAMVKLYQGAINYGLTRDDGRDIRFVDGTSGQPMSYEIEDWNEAGTSYVWVRIPAISTAGNPDSIVMYYGNNAAADGQDAAGTWDGDYVGVWHMHDTTGGVIEDATSYGNDGTNYQSRDTLGMVGNAQWFDATDDSINVPNDASWAGITGELTLEVCIRVNDPDYNSYSQIVSCKAPWNGAEGFQMDYHCFNNNVQILGSGGPIARASGQDFAANEWHYLGGTINNTVGVIHVDGGDTANPTSLLVTALAPTTHDLVFGCIYDGGFDYWNGFIDEIRISKVARPRLYFQAQDSSLRDHLFDDPSSPAFIGTGGPQLDSVWYRSGGTAATGDDTLYVDFTLPVEDDSLPTGTGGADSMFIALGPCGLKDATIKTGLYADDDKIIITFTDNDTIWSHLRGRLAMKAGFAYSLPGSAAVADTDSVVTFNAYAKGTGSYETISEAFAAAGTGDSILVFDAGVYAETLLVDKEVSILGYGWSTAGEDSLPIWTCGNDAPANGVLVNCEANVLLKRFNMLGTGAITYLVEADQFTDPDVSVVGCLLDGKNVTGVGVVASNAVNTNDSDLLIDSCVIRNCTSRGVHNETAHGGGTGAIVRNSVIHHCGYGIYNEASQNFVYQNNKIYDCTDAIRLDDHGSNLPANGRIIGNLIYECANGIIASNGDGNLRFNLIAFNTIVQCTTFGIRTNSMAGSPDTVMYNIFWSNGTDMDTVVDASSQRPVADYNFHSGGNVGAWVVGANTDSGYPDFVDTVTVGGYDWSLNTGSPVINLSGLDAAAMADIGLPTDLAGNPRPGPSGTYADLGAYEDQVYVQFGVDSVKYWGANSGSVADDSAIVWFSYNLEFDSLPLGAGQADSLFGVLGLGDLRSARIDTPAGCPDTNFIFIEMSAADTVFCRNRTRLVLRDSVVYSSSGAPAAADTDSVVTRNVYVLSSGNDYNTLNGAYAAAVAGDSILVLDAGLYPETLAVGRVTTIVGYGIDYGAYDSLPVVMDPGTLTDSVRYQFVLTANCTLVSMQVVTMTDSVRPVSFWNSSDHLFKKCRFNGTGNAQWCILENQAADPRWYRGTFTLDSSEVWGFTSGGFYFRHDDVNGEVQSLTNSHFHDITGPVVFFQDGDDAVFSGNTVHDVQNDWGIVRATAYVDITLTDNTVYDCGLDDYGAFTLDWNSSDFEITGNAFYNCTNTDGAIWFNQAHDGLIANNLIYDCTRGIYTTGTDSCYGNLFAFNTVVNCSAGVSLRSKVVNPDTFKYNIVWSSDEFDLHRTGAAPVADYNYYRPGGLGTWTAGAHSDSGYPRFVDTVATGGYDWQLDAASPCLDFTDADPTAAAAMGVAADINGDTRPAPVGSYADAGCYEDQISIALGIDSVKYYSCGTGDAADDSMFVWFHHNIEYDSLPGGGTDAATKLFSLVGYGDISNAVFDTIDGLPDSNVIVVRMNADDTVLSHDRSYLALRADSAYTAVGEAGAWADTHLVTTFNVCNMNTGTSYELVMEAVAAKGAGSLDTLKVMDFGLYTEAFDLEDDMILFAAERRGPTLGFNGTGFDRTSYEAAFERVMIFIDSRDTVFIEGFNIDGLNGQADTADAAIFTWYNTLTGYVRIHDNAIFNTEHRAVCPYTPNRHDIDSNEVYWGRTGIDVKADGADLVISNNLLHDLGFSVSPHVYALGTYNSDSTVVYGNVIYGCPDISGIYMRNSKGNTVHDNLVIGCMHGIFTYSDGSDVMDDYEIYNNTLYGNSSTGIMVSDTTTHTVYNNIAWNNGVDIDAMAAALPADSIRYNCFGTAAGDVDVSHPSNMSSYPVFVDTTDKDGADGTYRTGDDGLALRTSSPCLDVTANTGAGTDIRGFVRPLPAGSNWDMGCYEETTAVQLTVDSVHYYSAGTESWLDDSIVVWFSDNLEFDSLPLGAGNADHAFTLAGLGDIRNATIDTPGGMPDTNFIFIEMNAGDTILCHDRSVLRLVADSVFSTVGAPCQADTDSVATYNVHVPGTGSYLTIHDAHDAAAAGDSIKVLDAGLYAETLTVSKALVFRGLGIDFGTVDSLPVWSQTSVREPVMKITESCTVSYFKFLGACDTSILAPGAADNEQILIRNCEIDGNDTARFMMNVYFYNDEAITVDSCDIHGLVCGFLQTRGDGPLTVSNNTVYDIRGQELGGNDYYALHLYASASSEAYVTNNVFHDCRRVGAIGLRSWADSRFTGNLIFNCRRGINWFYDTDQNQNNYFAFNTVVQCTTLGIGINTNGTDTVKYNIAWSNGGNDLDTCDDAGSSRPVAGYNYYSSTGDWAAGPGSGSGYPYFADTTDADGTDNVLGTTDDGWALSDTSPCIGLSGVSAAGTDLAGTARPAGAPNWDLGAYENTGGAFKAKIYVSNSGNAFWPYTSPTTATDNPVEAFHALSNLNGAVRDTILFYETGLYTSAVGCTISFDSVVVQVRPSEICTLARDDASTDSTGMITLVGGSAVDYVRIYDLALDGNGVAGGGIAARTVNCRYNEFYGLDIFEISNAGNPWEWAGIFFGNNDQTGKVINCKLHDIGSQRSGVQVNNNAGSWSQIEIAGCEFYDIPAYAAVLFWNDRNTNTYIHHNLFYNCANAIDGGITGTDTSAYDTVVYNTVYNCVNGIHLVGVGGMSKRNLYRYNVLWGNTNDFTSSGVANGWTFDHNCYESLPGGVTAGTGDVTSYPAWADTAAAGGRDFSLTPYSPCINASGSKTAWYDKDSTATPIGLYNDLGCYENPSPPPRVDSVKYYSAGTASAADDSMIVWFSENLEFDSLDFGAGNADLHFVLSGLGDIGDATIDTPAGCPDTNFIFVEMNANDTVLSHLRSRLALVESVIYSGSDYPAVPDTDSVTTYNVCVRSSGGAYTTILAALENGGAVDGDTIRVHDAGYYTDTLHVRATDPDSLRFDTDGILVPVIKHGGASMSHSNGGDRMLVEARDRATWWDGFAFNGINFAQNDTDSVLVRIGAGGVHGCTFHGSRMRLLVVSARAGSTVVESCTFVGHGAYNASAANWADTSAGSAFRANVLRDFNDSSFPAIWIYGRQSLFEHNRFEDAFIGTRVIGCHDHVFRNNVYYNIVRAYIASGGKGQQLVNNTFCDVKYGADLDTLTLVKSNLFTSMGDGGWCLDSAANVPLHADSITYNMFDTIATEIPHYMTHATNVITATREDALLADTSARDFHLAFHSPAIDRGDTAAAYDDLDGSRCDMGAYGGPHTVDTLMPPKLDTLKYYASETDGSDSLNWTRTVVTDFRYYLVYRDTVDGFVPAESLCIDSIGTKADTAGSYVNNGKHWYYKVSCGDNEGYGGGYVQASGPVLQLFKRTTLYNGARAPGDTVVYKIFYDNDGRYATADTTYLVDYVPEFTALIDTFGLAKSTGAADIIVEWLLRGGGSFTGAKPARMDTVQAVRWKIPPAVGAHSNADDEAGADSVKGTVDTTQGTDSGWVRFRVRIR